MARIIVSVFIVVFLPVAVFARMMSENYFIDSDSLDTGGGHSTSTNYVLDDAFGEIATGNSASANYNEESFIASYLFRTFSFSAPFGMSFASKTVSTLAQTTSGTIANIEVIDDGTVGWSLTMTARHFTATSSVQLLAGGNATVHFTGTYDGLDGVLSPNGTFLVEITTGGAVGTAVFKWTDPAGNSTTDVATAASVALSNGIHVQFSPATYIAGDKWSINVDVFPYTGLIMTPGVISIINGESGVTAGSAGAFLGSGAISAPRTLMTGASNNSAGTYRQNEELELGIHANSINNHFKADAVLTII